MKNYQSRKSSDGSAPSFNRVNPKRRGYGQERWLERLQRSFGNKALARWAGRENRRPKEEKVWRQEETGGREGKGEVPDRFCRPFRRRGAARNARRFLQLALPVGLRRFMGGDKASVVLPYWRLFLSGGAPSEPIRFTQDDEVGQAFKESHDLKDHMENYLIPMTVDGIDYYCSPRRKLDATRRYPVTPFLAREDREFPIEFTAADSVPGNLAGGVGRSPVLPGGRESRHVSGTVSFDRDEDSGVVRMRANYRITILDSLDFCSNGEVSGNPGLGKERIATVPMSRLQATEGFAKAVPFEVSLRWPTVERTLSAHTVESCFASP